MNAREAILSRLKDYSEVDIAAEAAALLGTPERPAVDVAQVEGLVLQQRLGDLVGDATHEEQALARTEGAGGEGVAVGKALFADAGGRKPGEVNPVDAAGVAGCDEHRVGTEREQVENRIKKAVVFPV